MEKRDFLQIWGALQAYEDNVQHKAMDAAARGDETGRQLSASYLKKERLTARLPQ